jgi:hypothetical protein
VRNGKFHRIEVPRGWKGVIMFIARDENSDLYLFAELPKRGSECWWAESGGIDGTYLRLDKSLYPEVTWDSEPLSVRLELQKP